MKIGGRYLAVTAAAVLAIVGPLLFDYHALLGIAQYPTPLADLRRQLAAPLFVVIGYLLQGTSPLSPKSSMLLCVLFFAALIAEQAVLRDILGNVAIANGDGLIATFLFGTAVFQLARSLNDTPAVTRFANLGAISLAIYICHMLFIWIVPGMIPAMPGRLIVLFAAIAAASTATAMVLIRIPGVRRVVT